MPNDHNYNLVEPFDIDGDELEGLTPQMIFTLGVEWQLFRQQLQEGGPFERQVHTANAERLKALCLRHNWKVTEHWLHDDFEGWRVLRACPPEGE